ncbi:MAG: lysylphosphatidylglycerol synthase transmembrane domain-containing protein [Methylococcaceae bacterium]
MKMEADISISLSQRSNMEKTNPLGLFIVKIIISGLMLIILMSRLNWQIAFLKLQNISISTWLCAFLLYFSAQVVSALRWMLISKSLKLNIPGKNYFDWYFLGIFCNLFLPTGIGGDVVKSYALGRASGQLANAICSVVLDRVFGLIILLGLGALAAFVIELRPFWLRDLLLLSATLGFFLLLTARTLTQWLSHRWLKINTLVKPVNLLWHHPAQLLQFGGLSVVVQLFTIAAVVILGWQLGIDQPILFYIAAYSVISIISLFPLAINGFGVREFGFVMLFVTAGSPQESALILSFVSFSLQAAAGSIGLISFLKSRDASLSTSTSGL